ncbi:MAG: hypothetical protein H6728_07295 [Myxococcales bacterium]|nr:hypothetical protein [Myxococcales bacterium]MCB9642866.1 hypothetical protein [Myxococcales bacterium]
MTPPPSFEAMWSQLQGSEQEANTAIEQLQELVQQQPQAMLPAIPSLLRHCENFQGKLLSLQLANVLVHIKDVQPQAFAPHLDSLLALLSRLSKEPMEDDDALAGTLAVILWSLVQPLALQDTKLLERVLPVALLYLHKGHSVRQLSFSFVTYAAMQAPRLLADRIEQLFQLQEDDPDLAPLGILMNLYPYAPKAFSERVGTWVRHATSSPQNQGPALHILWEIAKQTPSLLVEYIPSLKGALDSPATAASLGMILLEVANHAPQAVAPLREAILQTMQHSPMLKPTAIQLLGILGRQDHSTAQETLALFFSMLQGADQNSAILLLSQVRHLADMDRALLQPYAEALQTFTQDNRAAVAAMARDLSQFFRGEDLSSISQKLAQQSLAIQEAARSIEGLRTYIDQHVEELREFIATISKKLPIPARFTTEGLFRKTLTLHFVCDTQGSRCLFPEDRPFTTETTAWNKWLKIAFSAVSAGKALLVFRDTERTVDKIKQCYEAYKGNDDDAFLAYISQPFLTSKETDALIEQLRNEKFFEVFHYDPQHAHWNCALCHATK